MDITEIGTLLQVSLIARAIFFAVVFIFAGWLTLHTNERKLKAVIVLGMILIGVGLFNVVMAIEWFVLFY